MHDPTGKSKYFCAYPLEMESSLTVYKINGSNYFKLRDLGKALDFNVGWRKDKDMYIEGSKSYTDAD